MSENNFLSQVKDVAEGWKNVLLKKPEVETVAQARLLICRQCEKNSLNNPPSLRPDEHCTDCGCPLISKTRCMHCECPLKKWLKEEDGNQTRPEGVD